MPFKKGKDNWKDIFEAHLVAVVGVYNFNDYKISLEKEFRFDVNRKFRFDYAVPELRVAFEFEGYGRHQHYYYYTKDCEKYNLATIYGWRVFRLTALLVKTLYYQNKLSQYILQCLNSSQYYPVEN